MKTTGIRTFLVLLLSTLFLAPTVSGQEEEKKEWNHFNITEDLFLSLNGYLNLYHIRNTNSYYNDANAAFTEVSMGLGVDLTYKDEFSGQIRLVGTGLYGRPDNYLGTQEQDMEMLLDLANASWHMDVSGWKLHLTAGLQEIVYGDGFLIMDGYSEERAIWTTPIRSFPAIKGSLEMGKTAVLDLFAAHVRDDFMSYEAFLGMGQAFRTGGSLAGGNLHVNECVAGTVDLGVFIKNEGSDSTTRSDTVALSLRDEIKLGPVTLIGELARQYGRTRVVNGGIAPSRVKRRAWGGHLTGRWDILDEGMKPYVQARYIHFDGDRDSTRSSEAFDPMFFGWADWGKWWIGDMTSFEIPHSNARILALEGGFHVAEAHSIRLFYFNTHLLQEMPFSTSKNWSHEVNVVYDFQINDYIFTGIMGGAAIPGKAAEDFNVGDRVNYEVITWVGFAF